MSNASNKLDSVTAIFEAASALAADRIRETLGGEKFDELLADPDAKVVVYVVPKERSLSVLVDWPQRFGQGFKAMCRLEIPELQR